MVACPASLLVGMRGLKIHSAFYHIFSITYGISPGSMYFTQGVGKC